jgi:hypothetical protein
MAEVSGVGNNDQQYGAQYDARSNAENIKTQFLTLLVAQLKNQDPMNPIDNQDFVAQLAQFSSLEQLITIGEGVDKIAGGVSERLDYLNDGIDYIAGLLTYLSFPDGAPGEEDGETPPADGETPEA